MIIMIVLCFCGTVPLGADQSQKDPFGADFIDGLTFFGESTTAHLQKRSSLRPEQVWANDSGTARLDSTLAQRPIRDAKTGDLISPIEAAERDTPDFLVLCFGLNGIMEFSQNPQDYLQKYQKLTDALSEASPNTRFLIQSVYPVAREEHQADWKFSVSAQEINQKIVLLNGHLERFCEGLSNVDFVDTSCKLTDSEGFLREDFTTDGIHLTSTAYALVLRCFSDYGNTVAP